MKKKLLAVLMSVCMVVAVAGCGKSDDAAANASGVETVTKGKLTVATSPDFAPYEFYAIDEDGTPTMAGFDVALAKYIANYIIFYTSFF